METGNEITGTRYIVQIKEPGYDWGDWKLLSGPLDIEYPEVKHVRDRRTGELCPVRVIRRDFIDHVLD